MAPRVRGDEDARVEVDALVDAVTEAWSLRQACEQVEASTPRELVAPVRPAKPRATWLELLAALGPFDLVHLYRRLAFGGRRLATEPGRARMLADYKKRDATAKPAGTLLASDPTGRSALWWKSGRVTLWVGGEEHPVGVRAPDVR